MFIKDRGSHSPSVSRLCAFGDCLGSIERKGEDEFELKCNEDTFMPRSKVHYESGDSRIFAFFFDREVAKTQQFFVAVEFSRFSGYAVRPIVL